MEVKDLRDAYGDALIELAETNKDIVVVSADLSGANGTKRFEKLFPERSINVGVAEANMIGIAAGLSSRGKVPFASTFGVFASRRVFDQFFLSCNYAGLIVKLVGSDPGITSYLNGGTHMAFEDIAMMRTVPDLVVFEPCDVVSMNALVKQSAEHKGCTYMRLHRKAGAIIYSEDDKFELGKGKILRKGSDITIFAAGFVLVPEVLKAAELLEKEGITAAVVDMHTYKPIDRDLILKQAGETKYLVTCENHQIIGGLGSAVAEVLADEGIGRKLLRIGIEESFGEVGKHDYLMERFGFTAEKLCGKIRTLID